MSPRTCRVLAAFLILGSSLLRVLYFASPGALDLSPDEAHYWDWSRHLDWSYYSKGPLVACLIRASCELTGPLSQQWTGNQMLSVRLPAFLCGALLLAALYVLTTLVFRREVLSLGVVALGLTLPILSAGSSLMTIDAPYTCCWAWALVFGHLAVFHERLWAWMLAGLTLALGILAKYTMILFVPSLVLFLLSTPEQRPKLFERGFWAMLLVGAAGGLPILWWNYRHDWVSVSHLSGHAGLQDSTSAVHWLGPLYYVGLQFAILLGYWFIVWCAAIWSYRPWRSSEPAVAYLWWMSTPMFLFFLLFSWKNGGGEANWPVAAYLSGLVLCAAWLSAQLRSPVTWYRLTTQCWLILFCAVGLGLTLLIHHSSAAYEVLSRFNGPATAQNSMPMRRFDPTCRLQGWRTLAGEVDRIRTELEERGEQVVLAGNSWNVPGQLGFYCAGQPVAYSFGAALGERHSQYDLWHPNPVDDGKQFLGRAFIFVGWPDDTLRAAFEHVETPRDVMHIVDGHIINRWAVTVAHGYRGFSARQRERKY